MGVVSRHVIPKLRRSPLLMVIHKTSLGHCLGKLLQQHNIFSPLLGLCWWRRDILTRDIFRWDKIEKGRHVKGKGDSQNSPWSHTLSVRRSVERPVESTRHLVYAICVLKSEIMVFFLWLSWEKIPFLRWRWNLFFSRGWNRFQITSRFVRWVSIHIWWIRWNISAIRKKHRLGNMGNDSVSILHSIVSIMSRGYPLSSHGPSTGRFISLVLCLLAVSTLPGAQASYPESSECISGKGKDCLGEYKYIFFIN